MKCPFCGDRISAGAVKCPNCSEYIGETLSYDEEMKLRARDNSRGDLVVEKRELSMEDSKRPFHAMVRPGKKPVYAWIWNVAAILVLAAVIAGLYLLNKQA